MKAELEAAHAEAEDTFLPERCINFKEQEFSGSGKEKGTYVLQMPEVPVCKEFAKTLEISDSCSSFK